LLNKLFSIFSTLVGDGAAPGQDAHVLGCRCRCDSIQLCETCQARIQFRVHRCHSPSARTTINVNKLHTTTATLRIQWEREVGIWDFLVGVAQK